MKAIKMVTEKTNYTCFCLLFSQTAQKTTSKLEIGHFRDSKKERIIGGFEKLLFSSHLFHIVLWELEKGKVSSMAIKSTFCLLSQQKSDQSFGIF
jgi:hypothetical protein